MSELTMPKLSDAMEEGTILRWLKADGETVAAEEELVEIETDKATVTHVAGTCGALQIVVPEGSTVPVGAVIARIGPRDQTPSEVPGPTLSEPVDSPGSPVAAPKSASGNGHSPASAPTSTAAATPLARRIAREHGLDLDQLRGSGPRGRITRADVLAATGGVVAPPRPRTSAAAAPTPPRRGTFTAGVPTAVPGPVADGVADFEVQEPTRVQRLIARRMSQARATIPDFEVATDAVMDHVLAIRSQLRKSGLDTDLPSVNDFVVKACAIVLRGHPRVNGSYADGSFRLNRRVHVGVAVAAEEALIVPVVRDADSKSLGTIAAETRALAARARAGEITPGELSGGTFTVSNLGMFGMTSIRPVINPPQAAILGVGAIREVLGRVDGEIVERQLMTLTMSADHRILYGADAARFLAEVRALVESPLRLLL